MVNPYLDHLEYLLWKFLLKGIIIPIGTTPEYTSVTGETVIDKRVNFHKLGVDVE